MKMLLNQTVLFWGSISGECNYCFVSLKILKKVTKQMKKMPKKYYVVVVVVVVIIVIIIFNLQCI